MTGLFNNPYANSYIASISPATAIKTAPPAWLQPRPVASGSLAPHRPTLGEKIRQKASDALAAVGMDRWNANKLGGGLGDLADYLTPVGNVTQLDEGARQTAAGIQNRSLWQTAGGVGGMALAALPVLGAKLGAAERAGIRAYHASPHEFDRFSLKYIGTGEGNQSFGKGLYFAEHEGTMDDYWRKFSGIQSPAGELIDPSQEFDDLWQRHAGELLAAHNGDPEAAKQFAASQFEGYQPKRLAKEIDQLTKEGYRFKPAHRYEVQINADPNSLLDWDAPQWAQPEPVKDLLRARGFTGKLDAPQPNINQTASGRWTARNIWGEPIGTFADHDAASAKSLASMQDKGGGMLAYSQLGGNPIYSGLDTGEASRTLLDAGVPGIKYLDQNSRSAGVGTHNYVIFDDKLIDILRKYGLAGLIGGGATYSALNSQPAEARTQ